MRGVNMEGVRREARGGMILVAVMLLACGLFLGGGILALMRIMTR